MTASPTATVIGSGFGGLSLAIRLQGMGFQVTVLEKLDKAGGRAYVREQDGFYFDMGPTVITVPQFIEELLSIERGDDSLEIHDFPDDVNPVDYPNTLQAGLAGLFSWGLLMMLGLCLMLGVSFLH